MLTKRMRQTLEFIIAETARSGCSPSYDEMRDHLGLASKSGVMRLVDSLEERSFIRRLPHRSRSIEVLRGPDGGKVRQVISKPSRGGGNPTTLPLMGRIAAGVPIAAVTDTSRQIDIPSNLIREGEHFALDVVGDSMIAAGIHDGDVVILRRASAAVPGQIVVAFIDGEEATLKRLRRRGSTVGLEPANDAYATRWIEEDRIEIQGVLASLVRRY